MCPGTGLAGKGEDNWGPQRDGKSMGAPSVAALEISAPAFAKGHNGSYKQRVCK